MSEQRVPSEIGYYSEPYWLAQEGGWIKSLLLFFDEVAILLPDETATGRLTESHR